MTRAMRHSAMQTPLARVLVARIRERGPITFAEYMSECLYHPDHGYYNRSGVERLADFYTSVDVHPVFGRLLARQLAEMWAVLGCPEPFWCIEAGAGAGRLGKHVLDFAARELGDFYAALRYVAVERSPARRALQATQLEQHLARGRASCVSALLEEIPQGCVFSNELLDALPVHRVVQEGGSLRELYVSVEGEELREEAGPLSSPAIAEYFARQEVQLLEGQQAEAGLAACAWIEEAGRKVRRGFLLTVDYGHEAGELYNERHLRGTLLAYQGHRASEDFFRAPGEQDLTAHVNFTALDLWGRDAKLARTGLVSQSRFLLALGHANQFADLYEEGQGEVERIRARLLLKNLIFPEGMGETFKVFIQHTGIDAPHLTGLESF